LQLPSVFPTQFPSERWQVYDITERILRVDFTNCAIIDAEDRLFLNKMMEIDDIVLIIGGLVPTLNDSIWNKRYLNSRYGTVTCTNTRKYSLPTEVNDLSHLEENGFVALTISDYLNITKEKRKLNQHNSEAGHIINSHFKCVDSTMVDLTKESFYLTDVDLEKKFPALYEDFISNFKLKEVLPGGKFCLSQVVSNCAKCTYIYPHTQHNLQISAPSRLPLGPHLFIASQGCYTHLHQDGFGTVDSGHLNLQGYNEVLLLRRLTHSQKQSACSLLEYPKIDSTNQKYDPLHGLPHDDQVR